ncbi:hypothetical protein ACPEIC_44940 [Stenotrophomonas sp. NPDC087984]
MAPRDRADPRGAKVNTGRSVRADGVLPRFLLVVVLALGVFVMRTLGHPDGGSGAGGGHGSHPAPSAAPAEAGHAPAAPETKPCAPMTGMDMASLCVAALGVWVLGALLSAVLARPSGPPPRLPVASAVVARPDPPSRAPDLTALSVLRI